MPEPSAIDKVLVDRALDRALDSFRRRRPDPNSLGALQYLVEEASVACAEAREAEREVLGTALMKFAPDIAKALIERWSAAMLAEDEALNDLIGALRAAQVP